MWVFGHFCRLFLYYPMFGRLFSMFVTCCGFCVTEFQFFVISYSIFRYCCLFVVSTDSIGWVDFITFLKAFFSFVVDIWIEKGRKVSRWGIQRTIQFIKGIPYVVFIIWWSTFLFLREVVCFLCNNLPLSYIECQYSDFITIFLIYSN